jgi:hypothetical protein
MNQEHIDFSIEKVEALYDRYRSKIEHEDNLINQRIMWMITLHGLLFTAYGFSLSAEASSLSFIKTAPDAYRLFKGNLSVLRDAMIWIGIGSAFAALIGVVAANRAIRDDETQFRKLNRDNSAVIENPIGQRATNTLGMLCGLLMPILGGMVWVWIGGFLPSGILILGAMGLSILIYLVVWALR